VVGIRNPNRLDSFYEQLKQIHKERFPDLRFLQFIYHFHHWLTYEKQIDGFYLEEDEVISLIQEFADSITIF
jgi:hypothetical protein